MNKSTADRLKDALSLRNMKQIELTEKTGIGKSAISQYLSGKVTPKQDKIYLMAQALDVDEGWLMGYDVDIKRQAINRSSLPSLTPKDEREIAKDLENMINSLDNKSGMAAYNDPDDQEELELLKASLETSMRLAKQIAKKKYTPKKYRKE